MENLNDQTMTILFEKIGTVKLYYTGCQYNGKYCPVGFSFNIKDAKVFSIKECQQDAFDLATLFLSRRHAQQKALEFEWLDF